MANILGTNKKIAVIGALAAERYNSAAYAPTYPPHAGIQQEARELHGSSRTALCLLQLR